MSYKPIVSIIVPAYNVESFINHCIDSIRNQTFSDFELILVDDGSTDSTGNICDDYSRLDKRIMSLHTSNKGQSAARNAGMEIAKGRFLSFVDADDYVAPEMIETLYNLINEYNADIAECGFISVYKDRMVRSEFGQGIEFGEGAFLIEKFINSDIFYGVWSKFFRKSLFDHVRFPEGRIYEDTWMTLYFCLENPRYVRTQASLYYYNQREGSTLRSATSQQKAREYIYILEQQLDLINRKVTDKSLKARLEKRIMEKSVLWYLDLALSNNVVLRKIYSLLYLKRMNFGMLDCLASRNLRFRNKFSFILCSMGLGNFARTIKSFLSKP